MAARCVRATQRQVTRDAPKGRVARSLVDGPLLPLASFVFVFVFVDGAIVARGGRRSSGTYTRVGAAGVAHGQRRLQSFNAHSGSAARRAPPRRGKRDQQMAPPKLASNHQHKNGGWHVLTQPVVIRALARVFTGTSHACHLSVSVTTLPLWRVPPPGRWLDLQPQTPNERPTLKCTCTSRIATKYTASRTAFSPAIHG